MSRSTALMASALAFSVELSGSAMLSNSSGEYSRVYQGFESK